MRLGGKFWKSKTSNFWIAEVALLDVTTQAETREDLPVMLKEAIELLVDDPSFNITAELVDNNIFVDANDAKKLMALILKRQRLQSHLTLQDVAHNLNAKSINEYAQYEQGKHLPSVEKLEEILNAINPDLKPFFSCN